MILQTTILNIGRTPPDDSSTLLVEHARAAMARRDYSTAADLFALAAQLGHVEDAAARRLWNRAIRQVVPRWHFSMMNDVSRNEAYAKAIRSTVRPGDTVLDIGMGAGLLSLMAARAGADLVVGCEVEPILARIARQVVADNGYDDRIQVLLTRSTDMRIGVHLPRAADVLVTEIFDCALLGEGILPTLAHARRDLLAPNARIVPYAAQLWGLIVESEELHARNHVRTVCNFDLHAFEQLRSLEYFSTYLSSYRHRPLTAPFVMAEFDFRAAEPFTIRTVSIDPKVAGVGHAIVMWFDLCLAPGVTLSNSPNHPGTHWRQAVQTFADPVACTPGVEVSLTLTYDLERVLVSADVGAP